MALGRIILWWSGVEPGRYNNMEKHKKTRSRCAIRLLPKNWRLHVGQSSVEGEGGRPVSAAKEEKPQKKNARLLIFVGAVEAEQKPITGLGRNERKKKGT